MGAPKEAVLRILEETGVVAVVRAEDRLDLEGLAGALRDGGVRLIEITMTVPGALGAIEAIARQLGRDVLVGAGTVVDPMTARLAISAGATFIVGPSLDENVISMAHLYGVAAIPGCLTPTEITHATAAGADVIKLFPGRIATPEYFTDLLRGPFPHVRLMPTGNVDLRTTSEYVRAGAVAVGVGKALVNQEAVQARDWEAIAERARQFRGAVDAARATVQSGLV